MAVETNLGHAFEIDLNQSINTETVDFDIQQIGMPTKPVSNNGFVRANSLTNLYKKSDSPATDGTDTLTTRNGDVVSLVDGVDLFVNGVKKNTIQSNEFIIGKKTFSNVLDCVVSQSNGHIGTLERFNTTSILKEYDENGIYIQTVSSFTTTSSPFGALARSPNTTISNIRYICDYFTPTSFRIYDIQTSGYILTVNTSYTIDDPSGVQFYITGQYFAIVCPNVSNQVVAGKVVSTTYGKLDGTGITNIPGKYAKEITHPTRVILELTWDFDSGDTSGWLYSEITLESTGVTISSVATGAGTLVNRVSSHGMAMTTNGAGVGSYVQKWYNGTLLTLNNSRNSNFSEFYSVGMSSAFAVWTVGGKASHLSLSPNTNGMGSLLTEVGELDVGASVQSYGTLGTGLQRSILWKTFSGDFSLVNILDASSLDYTLYPKRLFEPIDGVIFINSGSEFNVFEVSTGKIYVGSTPYNGAFIQTDVTGTDSKLVALKYEGKYSNTIDVGGILTNVGTTVATIQNTITPLYNGSAMPSLPIGIYIDGNYKNSQIKPNLSITPTIVKVNDSKLVGTLYVENSNLPIPVGSTVANDTAVSGQKTFFLNHNALAYPIGNELAQPYTIFRLQGSTYGFDGSDIWLIPFNTGTVQTPVWIAPATGLTFLCESPQAAFFLAEYDNSIYGFDGGRMVQRVMNLNRKPAIQNAVYNVEESALHVVTASSYMIVRDGIVTEHPRPFVSGTVNLYPSKNGVAREQAGAWSTLVLKSDTFTGETVEPLTWQSAVFGPEDSQTAKFSQFVFRIYNPAGAAPLTLTTTYKWITVDETGTETRTVSLVATDFDSNGYTVFRVNPAQDYALGASIGLSCDSAVVLLSAVCYSSNGGPSMPTKAV